MAKIATHTVRAPAHWASYLINGDATGFDYSNTPSSDAGDRDLANAHAFEQWCGADGGRIVDAGEAHFAVLHNVPALGHFAGDVCEYTILVVAS